MELAAGSTYDRYEVLELLGEGGMAVVYKVRHARLGSIHALKILSTPAISIRERLLQEGRSQAAIHHPNVLPVTDVIDVNGAPGLIMEFVAGPNLEALLDRHRPEASEAEALAMGIIAGVACAHRAGIIHRDLKPANVLIAMSDAGPVPKVADFGLAKLLSADGPMSRTRSGQAMGTPSYMAPEQIRNAKGVDHRADIFSIGAILYDLYCGRQAFPGDDILTVFQAITNGDFVPVRVAAPKVSDRVAAAIERALSVDPARRQADCESVALELTGRALVQFTSLPGHVGPWSPALISSVSGGGIASSVAGSGQTWASSSASSPSSIVPQPSLPPPSFVSSDGPDGGPGAAPVDDAVPTQPPPPAAQPAARRATPAVWPLLVAAGAGALALVLAVVAVGSTLYFGVSPDPKSGPDAAIEPAAELDPPHAEPPPMAQTSSELGMAPPAAARASAPAATHSRIPVADTVAPEALDALVRPDLTPPPSPVEAAPAPLAEPPSREPQESGAATEAADPTLGTVTFTGNKVTAVFLFAGQKRYPAGKVPAGVYTVEASFNGSTPVVVGTVRVVSGAAVTLQCSALSQKCVSK